MAGAGYKLFVNGNTLSASDLNTYVNQQTVMVFASAAARTTALSGVLAEGMVSYRTDSHILEYYTGSTWSSVAPAGYSAPTIGSTSIGSGATVTTIAGLTLTSPVENNPYITSPKELTTVSATAATGTVNFDILTQGVLYYTTNASANFTLNFRGNGATTLASIMNVGDAWSAVFLNTNGATPYYPTVFQVDGTATGVTVKWSGGTAPSAGNASAVDAYSFTIIKTAATPTYTVLAGGAVKFA